VPKRQISKPLRIGVYGYFKAMEGSLIGDCISAKVESGIVKEKDELLLMPFNTIVTIKNIESSKQRLKYALPGTLCDISLNLPSSFDPMFLKAGNVLCDPRFPVH
jgi:translation elongation factor EF-1alpha